MLMQQNTDVELHQAEKALDREEHLEECMIPIQQQEEWRIEMQM
jgi:hypothetical protein